MWIQLVCEQAVLFKRTSKNGTVADRSAHRQMALHIRLN